MWEWTYLNIPLEFHYDGVKSECDRFEQIQNRTLWQQTSAVKLPKPIKMDLVELRFIL